MVIRSGAVRMVLDKNIGIGIFIQDFGQIGQARFADRPPIRKPSRRITSEFSSWVITLSPNHFVLLLFLGLSLSWAYASLRSLSLRKRGASEILQGGYKP
ncbi:MAG: hypothetical protein ACLFVG_10040 [Candidatus Aminicenantes bacterium]